MSASSSKTGQSARSATASKTGLTVTPPTFTVKGAHNSLLLEMSGLGPNPASGRLLRGLTPYLDEQGASHVFLLTHRKRREPWSEHPEAAVTYQELIHWERGADDGVYRGTCGKGGTLKREEILQAFEYDPLSVIEWAARRLGGAVVSSREPMPLEICYVEKPWGREGWYTGIEKRGVSLVRSAAGATELPYALGMFPVPLIGEREVPPILLKCLDPLPDPVYGDLYLEVHREKWEVYVVLSVDRNAWPKGEGCLRAGLAPDVVAAYRLRHNERSESALAADLESRIKDYETVRRKIDNLLDEALEGEGLDPAAPVAPEAHSRLQASLPGDLQAEEREVRAEVEQMIGKVPLRPGDVVRLPPGVIHSLQHGVKVIEFQTPTYERLIAMFAQKVLTQPHWDVAEAVERMEKSVYEPPSLEVLAEREGILVEQVVDFPQFAVTRTTLELNRKQDEATEGGNRYQLLIVTQGKGELRVPGGEPVILAPEAAFLLPATLGAYSVSAIAAQGLTYLKAVPALEPNEDPVEVQRTLDDVLDNTW